MVSIREVANHAGVAISTVSKVLNGYPNISEKTNQGTIEAETEEYTEEAETAAEE